MPPRDSSAPMLMAPGSSNTARAVSFPGRTSPPSLESRLVEPEGTDEVIGGRRLRVSPSQPEHADPHAVLDALVVTHAAPTSVPASDLLTRTDEDSDFATDTSIRTAGKDPTTGTRYLEELAFEIVNTQSNADITEKAQRLTARGVRRVFGVFVRQRVVCEWHGGVWRTLAPDSAIEDPCLAVPLPVRAILDDLVNARDVIARALIAQGTPAIQQLRDQEQQIGIARSILTVLDARGMPLPDDLRERVLACRDAAQLTAWLRRAATEASIDAVFAEDDAR